jgi:hypothetical protein
MPAQSACGKCGDVFIFFAGDMLKTVKGDGLDEMSRQPRQGKQGKCKCKWKNKEKI